MNNKLMNIDFQEGADNLSFLDNYLKSDVEKVLEIVQQDNVLDLVQNVLELLSTKNKVTYFDKMSTCLNRNAYECFLDELGKKNSRENKKYERIVNVCLLDGESFKRANDTLGYENGDFIIESIGKNAINFLNNLNNSLHTSEKGCPIELMGKTDFILRLGGDEFVSVSSEYISVEELRNACCVKTSEIFGVDFDVSVSIGHAFGPLRDFEKLVRVAAKNMHDDKKRRGAKR